MMVRYKDETYLSKVEARWAVAMDHSGVRYEHEPCKVTLSTAPSVRYIPDFWLTDYAAWLEIKMGVLTPEDPVKWSGCVGTTGAPVWVANGGPLGFVDWSIWTPVGAPWPQWSGTNPPEWESLNCPPWLFDQITTEVDNDREKLVRSLPLWEAWRETRKG